MHYQLISLLIILFVVMFFIMNGEEILSYLILIDVYLKIIFLQMHLTEHGLQIHIVKYLHSIAFFEITSSTIIGEGLLLQVVMKQSLVGIVVMIQILKRLTKLLL